jgi:phosphoribosylamine---glycine ligase
VRVLFVGGGGREQALCWAVARSSRGDRLFAAPGNAGTADLAEPVPTPATEVDALAGFAHERAIDLTVVGPEAPLVAGLADAFDARGLAVFGPDRAAARLEGSKAWARKLCDDHGIPAPRSREFTELAPALAFLDEVGGPPFVVKADGLAAGKGVTVAEDRTAAEAALRACLVDRQFGDAGDTVLVEEYLEGREVSAMALCDGETVVPLALAQDHKRAWDGDRGPNTGGMGAYSPLAWIGDAKEAQIVNDILQRTARALAAEGVRYRGVIYAGLMLTADGPKVLEYNCRFGDPETQVVLPRMRSDLADALLACVEGDLGQHPVDWSPEASVGVVLASRGYPGPYPTGVPIEGLDKAAATAGLPVFHSGTAVRDGRVVTAGGRVLTVSALGPTVQDARDRVYEACSLIEFDGMHFRRDIAERTP